MKVKSVPIQWHPGMPIFARESFLKTVGDEYGWLGGFAGTDELQCILPYTVIRKGFLRMVRFRVETIPQGRGVDLIEERAFLNGVMAHFRAMGIDLVIPATTNAIFRTYPDGAEAAPYGSYVIDLRPPEETLWRNIGKVTRQNIGTAQRSGMTIRSGLEHLETAYRMTRDTFKRSRLPFMDYASYERFARGLGENGRLLVAEDKGVAQSCTIFAFSDFCAYAVYAGNIPGVSQGAMKWLQWEAIRSFRDSGVRLFDFVGARIDPPKGSKQEALNLFKQRFGAELRRGYIWKYALRPVKYLLYGLASRLRSGGDIVDAERHKMINPGTGVSPSETGPDRK